MKYPELMFTAYIDHESQAVSSNYITKRYCNDFSKKIEQNIDDLSTDYYVNTIAMLNGIDMMNKDESIEKYMEENLNEFKENNEFGIHLFLNNGKVNFSNGKFSLTTYTLNKMIEESKNN